MSYEQARDEEIERIICNEDISEAIAVAVDSMINGAIEGLMVNLGHTVSCDPALSCDFGRRLLCAAVDEFSRRTCQPQQAEIERLRDGGVSDE